MSLSRLALRLAAIEALNPSTTIVSGPWPTIGGPRVYDSRIDMLDEGDMAAIEGQPIVIVFTEKDELQFAPETRQDGEEICELTIELMIAARGTVTVENADGTTQTIGVVTAPISDRQHEALLDVLEGLVRRALGIPTTGTRAPILRKVLMEVRHVESVPQRAADRVTRLAARTLCITTKIMKDAWPVLPLSPAPSGFGLFPQPLQDVANLLPSGSSGYALCTALAPLITQPVTPDALTDIHLFVGVGITTPTQLDGSDSNVQADVEFS